MYPFERKMHDLKKTVLNKNRVEASICESNILSEITFFCSHYFGSDIETRLNRQPRNIVGVNDDMDNCLSVFKHHGQPLGGEMRMRALSPKELKAAELYVLLNCEEVNPWMALFEYQVCSGLSDDQIQIKRQLEFIPWFKTMVCSGRCEVDSRLLPLVTGPVSNVRVYNDEPFILANQAQQVFYASYPSQNPSRKGWFAACKIRARAIIETSSLSDGGNVYYQDDHPLMPQLVQPSTVLNDHVSLSSQGGEQVVINEVMQLPYVAEEECVGEDDDEEEEFDGTETSEEEVPNYLTESDSD
ncbi:hypothetical protein SLA2020_114540 [Shorea laevis]